MIQEITNSATEAVAVIAPAQDLAAQASVSSAALALLRFRRSNSQHLQLCVNGEWQSVRLQAAFPSLNATSLISVQNAKGEELMFIEQLSELSEYERHLVGEQLRLRNFRMEMVRIARIEDSFDYRVWDVLLTGEVMRSFLTRLDDWPDLQSDGYYRIEDLSGDSYYFDARSIDVTKVAHLL